MTIEANRAEIHLWTIMRGLAALAVVVFHFKTHVAYPLVTIPIIGAVIRNGDLGVDMFFVLSGFVMTYVYGLPATGNRFDYRKFYIRRLARTYPVHFVTLIGALAMLLLGSAAGLAKIEPSLVAFSIPVQLLLLHGIGRDIAPTLNYPSWSVSSEMFAYLLFPVFALLYRRIRTPLPLIMFTVVMLYVMMDLTALAVIGAIRVSVEFVLGMGLCLLLRDCHSRRYGLVAMTAGAALFVIQLNLGGWRSIAIAGLAITISGAFVAREEQRPSWPMRVLIYVGQISYSIYMVHALIEAPGFKIAQLLTGAPEDRNGIGVFLLLIATTLAAAAILYHVVEQPCRRAIVAFADRRARSSMGADGVAASRRL